MHVVFVSRYWLPRVKNNCLEMGNAVLCLDDMTEENGCLVRESDLQKVSICNSMRVRNRLKWPDRNL